MNSKISVLLFIVSFFYDALISQNKNDVFDINLVKLFQKDLFSLLKRKMLINKKKNKE